MKKPEDSEEKRRATFKECMDRVAAAFRQDVGQAMMAAYWSVLGQYDCSRIEEGFRGALANEEFWPTPAKIRKYIRQVPEDIYPELK